MLGGFWKFRKSRPGKSGILGVTRLSFLIIIITRQELTRAADTLSIACTNVHYTRCDTGINRGILKKTDTASPGFVKRSTKDTDFPGGRGRKLEGGSQTEFAYKF